MKNGCDVRGDVTAIYLHHDGKMIETLISTSDLRKAKSYTGTWYAQWHKSTNSFYVKGNVSTGLNGSEKTVIRLHRFLLNPAENMVVDHVNHNTLDNTRGNLKVKTNSENLQNRKGSAINSKSGIRGVCWNKTNKNWEAKVYLNNKTVFRKNFNDIKLAEQAVIEARLKYHKQ